MKKILLVFGTRPEAIKMAPVAHELVKNPHDFTVKICVTAQHREMLDQVLDFFGLVADYDLNIMQKGQSLSQITSSILSHLNAVYEHFEPDLVLVHGDTTTTMTAALTAFYRQIPVGHVEAGLRSFNKQSPFPEEANRCMTTTLSQFHFPPTEAAANNLAREGVSPASMRVTGNTVIDALVEGLAILDRHPERIPQALKDQLDDKKRMILVTAHRRENLGEGFENIADALLILATEPDVQVVLPMHLNPKVREVMLRKLVGHPRIILIEPQPYEVFLWLMKKSHLILTDSGGIQEEAPSLGKPVLVMRDTTERPEGLTAGVIRLVGTQTSAIVHDALELLGDEQCYQQMATQPNPFGDGHAAAKIIAYLKEHL